MNSNAVKSVFEGDEKTADAIMGGNAVRILRLES